MLKNRSLSTAFETSCAVIAPLPMRFLHDLRRYRWRSGFSCSDLTEAKLKGKPISKISWRGNRCGADFPDNESSNPNIVVNGPHKGSKLSVKAESRPN